MSDINYCPHCGHSLAQYRLMNKVEMQGGEDDDLYLEILTFAIDTGSISASLLQRRFKIGYSRAARFMDTLEANDVIGPADGAKPRKVLFDNKFDFVYSLAVKLVISKQKASTSLIQKELGIDKENAIKIIDRLELHGIIGPANGAKARIVLRHEE